MAPHPATDQKNSKNPRDNQGSHQTLTVTSSHRLLLCHSRIAHFVLGYYRPIFHLVQKHSRAIERSKGLVVHLFQPEDHRWFFSVDSIIKRTAYHVVDSVRPSMQDQNVRLKVPCEGRNERLIRIVASSSLHSENEYLLFKDSETQTKKSFQKIPQILLRLAQILNQIVHGPSHTETKMNL